MTVPTTAARAALARRRRSARAPAEGGGAVRDPCPLCRVELALPRGNSRRLLGGLDLVRGVFRWSCPDCRGAWAEGPSKRGARPPSGS